MFPIKDTIQSRRLPIVNYLIIGANVAVFLLEASLGPRDLNRLIRAYGLIPIRLVSDPGAGQITTVFASMFLHGGWLHLISNMWTLYIFGDNVEDRMGHVRYLLFYFISGVAAAAAHILTGPGSRVPVVGASGAISGVLAAYLILFPNSRVITLLLVFFLPWFVEIPALFYLGFWFVSQLFNGVFALSVTETVGTYGGVAYLAHIGGFLAGLLLVKVFEQRRAFRQWHSDEYWPW